MAPDGAPGRLEAAGPQGDSVYACSFAVSGSAGDYVKYSLQVGQTKLPRLALAAAGDEEVIPASSCIDCDNLDSSAVRRVDEHLRKEPDGVFNHPELHWRPVLLPPPCCGPPPPFSLPPPDPSPPSLPTSRTSPTPLDRKRLTKRLRSPPLSPLPTSTLAALGCPATVQPAEAGVRHTL